MMNVGIIGYGYWGPNLLRNFAETPGVSVRAVADLDLNKLESVQKRYPAIRVSTDFTSLLARSDDRRGRHRHAGDHALRARRWRR